MCIQVIAYKAARMYCVRIVITCSLSSSLYCYYIVLCHIDSIQILTGAKGNIVK